MLRRLKAQVSQVASELPDLLNNSNREGSMDGEREGFLCPICMSTFQSPEQLSVHFEGHSNEQNSLSVENPNFSISGTSPSVDKGSTSSQGSAGDQFSSKEKEIEELKQQIKDEKWFSSELKKELDRIQAVVAQSQDVPQEEVPYLMQQIQMLEAGKSMVTQRMLEVEKDCSGLRRSLDGTAQEKKEVMDRLKQLTERIRQLTEENEENKATKAVFGDELNRVNRSMTELENEVEKLNQTLDQRPSEDDVAVLRKELINAQHLMDEIAQQKDVEIKEHLNSIRLLSGEREKQHCMIGHLQKQMNDSGLLGKETSEQLSRLASEVEDLKQKLDSSVSECDILKESVISKEKMVEEKEHSLSATLKDLADCRIKVSQLEESVRTSGRSIEDSHELNEKNVQKLSQLHEKLEQLIEEKKKYEADLCTFEEKTQKQLDSIKNLEMSNMDLTNELSSMGSLLDKERQLLKEKSAVIEEKEKAIHIIRDQLDESVKSGRRKDESVLEKEAVIESLQKQVSTLKENASELMAKVSAGEGGAKMAIDQLSEEKMKLIEDVQLLGNSLKEQKVEYDEKIAEIEKQLKETQRDRADVERKKEGDIEELKRRIREAEDEVNRKAERFIEMEKETEEERRKTSERINKVKELLQAKEVSANEMRRQIEQLTTDLSDRDQVIREKERAMEDSRRQVEESLNTIRHAEEKAIALEAELSRAESERCSLFDSENDLRAKLSDLEQHVEEYKGKIGKLNEDIATKDERIKILEKDGADREEHWKTKILSMESQMDENHRANDDLLASNSDMNLKIEQLKKEIESKGLQFSDESSRSEQLVMKTAELENELQKLREEKEKIEEVGVDMKNQSEDLLKQLENWKRKHDEQSERVQVLEKQLEEDKKRTDIERKGEEQRVSSLESHLMESQQTVSALQQSIEDKDQEIVKLNDVRQRIEGELAMKISELEDYGVRVIQFEEQMSVEKRRVEKLESEKMEKTQTEEESKKRIQELESTLGAQIRSLNKEMERIQKEANEKDAENKRLSNRCSQLDGALIDLRDSTRMDMDDKLAQMEVLQQQVHDIEEQGRKRNADLSEEKENIRRCLESVKSDLEKKNKDSETILKTVEELAEKNAELQQKISAWEEEKNALIERCLNTESDLDFERDRAMENKRRFDDALSAMHELGRANQSLQMDMSKQLTRKWLDDSEAVNCASCSKVFSLTVRKHHCRVCGMIFCGACSNHTVKVASNKNPVRVCAPCEQEVLNR